MNKVILEFTYKGRKHTYLRRINTFGEPLTTTNIHSARKIKESEIKNTMKILLVKLGKDNVKDINIIKDED